MSLAESVAPTVASRAAQASGSTIEHVLETFAVPHALAHDAAPNGLIARATRRGARVVLLATTSHDEPPESVHGYFVIEARRVAAACDVTLVDVGSTRDVRWIVRPWIEGTPWIATPRSLVDAMSFLDPLARVLSAAHRAGIGHGALSPSRIVVAATRATVVDLIFAPFAPLGVDPRYAAPEWLERRANVDPVRTDVYALGLLVLEAVSGRPAYGDIADVELFARAVDRTRRPTLAALGVPVAASVERVLARALAVDPEARFPNAGEMFTALRAAVADAPTVVLDAPRPRVTSSPPPPPERRPRPPAAMVGGATIALVACALGIEALVSGALARRAPTVASVALPPAPSSAPVVVASIAPSAPPPVVQTPSGMVLVTTDPAFYVDRTEVTVASYRACVEAGACTSTWKRGSAYDESDPVRREWRCNLHRQGRDDHPVNCVSFVSANAYCTWAGKKLPSGAEWTRAARGDATQKYPWGESTPRCKEVVFARYGPANPGCDKQPVGTMPAEAHPKTASPFGALDMAGSLWEWTTERSPRGFPYLRGGAWDSGETGVMVESRLEQSPGNGDVTLGFRCVKDAS